LLYCGVVVMSSDTTEKCLVVMTFGRQEYAEMPLEKLAFPYGTPDRSRYLMQHCTDEAISMIERGYKGIGYYFLRVLRGSESHLVPLRKLEIQQTKRFLDDKLLINYNITDYVWSDADPAEISQAFKQVFEIETTSDKEILLFAASKTSLLSLIKTGSTIDSWGETVRPIQGLVSDTDIMNVDRKIPLLVCSILTEDKKGAQVVEYAEDGIIVYPNTRYGIELILQPLKEAPMIPLRAAMKADQSLITSIKDKDRFVAWYDEIKLLFAMRNWDSSVYTEAPITLFAQDEFCVAANELRLKLVVRKWVKWISYGMFGSGALFVAFADYFSRLAPEQHPAWIITIMAAVGAILMTAALFKLRR